MGIILDEVCCVHNINYNDTENDKIEQMHSMNKESKGRDSDKNLSIYKDKYYNSSLLTSLPQDEIIFTNKIAPIKEFESLKTIPINTEKIIRKQSGNHLDYYEIIKKLGKGTFGTV